MKIARAIARLLIVPVAMVAFLAAAHFSAGFKLRSNAAMQTTELR